MYLRNKKFKHPANPDYPKQRRKKKPPVERVDYSQEVAEKQLTDTEESSGFETEYEEQEAKMAEGGFDFEKAMKDLLQGLTAVIKKTSTPAPAPTVQIAPEVSEAIPKFTNNAEECSAKEWTQLVNQIGDLIGWTPKLRLAKAISNLDGVARDWHLGQGYEKTDWEQWCTAFYKAFPDEGNPIQRFEQMHHRIQQKNEPLENYFHAKVKLCQRCNLDFDTSKARQEHAHGYYQVQMDPESQEKTAFVT